MSTHSTDSPPLARPLGNSTDAGGVILVVADPQTAAALTGHNGPAIPVANYLEALGELARRPVQSIIGRLDPMSAAIEPTVRALRELAPVATCRIVLIIDADQEPQAIRAVTAGVDDYLVRPVTADELRRAVNDPASPPPFRRDAQRSAPAAELPLPAHPEPRNVPRETPLSGTPLGDTDLIQHLLTRRTGLAGLALQLIRQREPEHQIDFAPQAGPENPPPGDIEGSHAPVLHASRPLPLAHLTSPTLDPRRLAPYADWLAHWLALEARLHTLQHECERDELTGVANRRYFDQFLEAILRRARAERFRVTVMIFDIDDFKSYNDRYGHAAGDDILREAARLMRTVVRRHDVVARIGGDEFAVIFWDAEPPRREHSRHPEDVRAATARFQRAICEHRFPKLGQLAPATLTISGGLASFPWDGQTADELREVADHALLESKRAGKNVITFGPGAMKLCGLNGPRDTPGTPGTPTPSRT